jgi:hypothetical protein
MKTYSLTHEQLAMVSAELCLDPRTGGRDPHLPGRAQR